VSSAGAVVGQFGQLKQLERKLARLAGGQRGLDGL
jgi:hypothetical protein